MTEDKWRDTIDHITERFQVFERGVEPLPEYPNGKREFIVFQSPLGRVRLERVTKPRTTGQRAITSRRIGGAVKVEPIYDLDDLVYFIEAKRWNEALGAWEPFDPAAFAG